MADQIEGKEGKVSNVGGGNKDDDPSILEKHDLGVGYNTAAAMKHLDRNKAFFDRDRTAEGAYGAEAEPEMEYPGSMPGTIDHGLDK